MKGRMLLAVRKELKRIARRFTWLSRPFTGPEAVKHVDRCRAVTRLVALAALMPGIAGCASLFSAGAPPQYYQIEYESAPLECSRAWGEGVRVWPFSASAPYDREEMIILDADHKVRLSSVYRWVAVPGVMVADRLLKDLAGSHLFVEATSSVNRLAPALELSGHIHRFAWEDRGSGAGRAVLDAEVTLWREEPKREVIFRHHYRFESPPSNSGSPEGMAGAMSQLVQRLSAALQQDLCATSGPSAVRD